MKIKTITNQKGFTLIETLIAMAIFTIGILGLFGMQTSAIKENLSANNITTGATWAADRVEQLIGQDYTAALDLKDTDKDGCGGLDDRSKPSGSVADADRSETSGTVEPIYNIYWNVANNCALNTIPDSAVAKQEQKPKHLRIIVTRNVGSVEKEVAVFNYIKQNVQN